MYTKETTAQNLYKCNDCSFCSPCEVTTKRHCLTMHGIPHLELGLDRYEEADLWFCKNQEELNALEQYDCEPGWIVSGIDGTFTYPAWKENVLRRIESLQFALKETEKFIAQHPECKL